MKKFCSLVLSYTTHIRLFNVFTFVFFCVCFLLILEMVENPLILSAAKIPDFLMRTFWYRVLLFLISLFNLWLFFYPLLRLMSIYVLLLDVELKDFLFDILFFFISIVFSIIVVCLGTVLIEWVCILSCHITESAGDVNILTRFRTIILYDSGASSSERNLEEPEVKCLSPAKDKRSFFKPSTWNLGSRKPLESAGLPDSGSSDLDETNSRTSDLEVKKKKKTTTTIPPSVLGQGGSDGATVNPAGMANTKIDNTREKWQNENGGKLSAFQSFQIGGMRSVSNWLTNLGGFDPYSTNSDEKVYDGNYNPNHREPSINNLEEQANKQKKLQLFDRVRRWYQSPHRVDGVTPTGSPVDEQDVARSFQPDILKPSTWRYFWSPRPPGGWPVEDTVNTTNLEIQTNFDVEPKQLKKRPSFFLSPSQWLKRGTEAFPIVEETPIVPLSSEGDQGDGSRFNSPVNSPSSSNSSNNPPSSNSSELSTRGKIRKDFKDGWE
jgi:hypothetical protein